MQVFAGFGPGHFAGLRISAALVLACLALVACNSADQPEAQTEARVPGVMVTPVIERAINGGESKVARTSAVHRVALRARVSGALQKRAFEAGTEVDAGDLLYVIEPDQYAADAAAAKATVAEAKAAYNKANQYLKRLKSVARGGVSASDMETAQNDVQTAQARLAQARAKQRSADLRLGYTEIRAPIAGRISDSEVDTGNLIGPDSGVLATIVQMDPIHVDFKVSERESTRFLQARREADAGRAELDDYQLRLRLSDGTLYDQTGRLDYVASEVDRATGTLAMRAVVANPQGLLRPGQFVKALVSGAAPKKRLVVPQSAVQQDSNGHYVFVVDGDDTVARRPVELGARQQIDWVVDSGLRAGDRVIFQGLQKVRPGMTVAAQTGDPRAGLGNENGN